MRGDGQHRHARRVGMQRVGMQRVGMQHKTSCMQDVLASKPSCLCHAICQPCPSLSHIYTRTHAALTYTHAHTLLSRTHIHARCSHIYTRTHGEQCTAMWHRWASRTDPHPSRRSRSSFCTPPPSPLPSASVDPVCVILGSCW